MAFGGKAYREAVEAAAAREAASELVKEAARARVRHPPASDAQQATDALLSGVGQYVFENQRASCHPDRLAFKDGRCYACVAEEARRLDERQRPAAEAHQAVVALGEEAVARQVRGYLQANLEEYARLHVEATRIAASKGDAKPAEWALSTVKVGDAPIVAPPAKEGAGGGVKVLIGVQLGGLPPGTVPSPVISVTPEVLPATREGNGE